MPLFTEPERFPGEMKCRVAPLACPDGTLQSIVMTRSFCLRVFACPVGAAEEARSLPNQSSDVILVFAVLLIFYIQMLPYRAGFGNAPGAFFLPKQCTFRRAYPAHKRKIHKRTSIIYYLYGKPFKPPGNVLGLGGTQGCSSCRKLIAIQPAACKGGGQSKYQCLIHGIGPGMESCYPAVFQ